MAERKSLRRLLLSHRQNSHDETRLVDLEDDGAISHSRSRSLPPSPVDDIGGDPFASEDQARRFRKSPSVSPSRKPGSGESSPKEYPSDGAMMDFILKALALMALEDPDIKKELDQRRSSICKEQEKSAKTQDEMVDSSNGGETGILRKINDMRQRLSWLRRRQEGRGSVRPLPDEVQTWSSDFHNLMASKYGQALFRAFLQREFSEENIEFWVAVEEFRAARPGKLGQKAAKIHGDYVAPKAEKEVNLDAETRATIASCLSNPDRNMFDNAQRRIQALMESDAYQRFLQSELYKELLRPSPDSPTE